MHMICRVHSPLNNSWKDDRVQNNASDIACH